MKKQLNFKLIQYEMRNIAGNMFIVFFGVVFPILLSVLVSIPVKNQTPEAYQAKAVTSLFISMSMIIPMCILLIGYAVNYSMELEKEIPLRMSLFGFHERSMLAAKIIANLIFLTGAFLVYTIADIFLLDLEVPKPGSAICLIGSLYLIGILFIVLAHGIANFFRKFGQTYAITMFIYFGFMILCGMMGLPVNQMPDWMQTIAKLFPMTYLGSSDFVDFWKGGDYNFAPFVQSFLFLGAISFIILILSIRKHRRIIK